MDVGGYSATGPRDANEDNYYAIELTETRAFSNGVTAFILVSDGMGGYLGGDVASLHTVSKAEDYIAYLRDLGADLDANNQIDLDVSLALTEIAQNAHDAIVAEAAERGNGSMGATYVAAFMSDSHAWIGHIGDSRAYLIRNGVATQLTEDHSQVGRMLSRGLITEEEAQNHPARNRIERALGFSDDVTPEMDEIDLMPGDMLMLCSDGVYTVLNAAAIARCVDGAPNAAAAAEALVKTALRKGTDDNSTAVVAINAAAPAQPTHRTTTKTIPNMPLAAVVPPIAPAETPSAAGPTETYPAVAPVETPSAERLPVERPRVRPAGPRPPASLRRSAYRNRSSQTQPRRSWTWIIPAAIVLAAVIIVALILFGTGVLSFGPGEAVQEVTTQTATSTTTAPSPSSTTDNDDATSAQTTPRTPSTATTSAYLTGNQPVLKYLGPDETAYRFSEQPLAMTDIELKPDVIVVASTTAEPYGHGSQGKSYRMLDAALYKDLLSDLALYEANQSAYDTSAKQFNSALSEKISHSDYVKLLSELAEYDGSVEDVIEALVVDEDQLDPATDQTDPSDKKKVS